jgi:hypothetical protein
MKISEMPLKDRFDDLIDKVVAITAGIEAEVGGSDDIDLREEKIELQRLYRRLVVLRDDVLRNE